MLEFIHRSLYEKNSDFYDFRFGHRFILYIMCKKR